MDRDFKLSTLISKNNTDKFYLCENRFYQGMFDNGLLEDTCISLSFKSY